MKITGREIKLLSIAICIIFISIGAIKTIHWISIGEGNKSIDSYRVNGDILPYSEAKRQARDYTSEKKYFNKYIIEDTYERGYFPFMKIKTDTLAKELWMRKAH